MSKQATQTKINLSRGIVQAEESTIQDNSLLPAADELKRLVAIDKDLLEWIKRRAEIEQDERVSFNKHRIEEYRLQGKRTYTINLISLLMAFIIIAGGGTASVFLAVNGLYIEGSILGGVTLVAAAGVFLKKNKPLNQ
jgi:predicted  nucleic acid-binding Zn-ribbon protein